MAFAPNPQAPANQFQSPNIAPANQYQSVAPAPSTTAVNNKVASTSYTPPAPTPPPMQSKPVQPFQQSGQGSSMPAPTPAVAQPVAQQPSIGQEFMQNLNPSIPTAQAQTFQHVNSQPVPQTPVAQPSYKLKATDIQNWRSQGTKDDTIFSNAYGIDPNFKVAVDRMQPVLQANPSAFGPNNSNFNTWALNNIYTKDQIVKPDPMTTAMLQHVQNTANPNNQPPWWQGMFDATQAPGNLMAGGAEQLAGGVAGMLGMKGASDTLNNLPEAQSGNMVQNAKTTVENLPTYASAVAAPFTGGMSLLGGSALMGGATAAGQAATEGIKDMTGTNKNSVLDQAKNIGEQGLVGAGTNLAFGLAGKAAQGLTSGAKELLGIVTGAGGGSVDQALKSTSFNDAFGQGMRGDPIEQATKLASDTKQALDVIAGQRKNAYKVAQDALQGSTAQVDPEAIQGLLSNVKQEFGIAPQVGDMLDKMKDMTDEQSAHFLQQLTQSGEKPSVNPLVEAGLGEGTGAKKIGKAIGYISNWQDYSPDGLDRLQKSLSTLDPSPKTPESAFINSLKKGVQGQIEAVHPEYAQMLDNYHTASDSLRQLQTSLQAKNPSDIEGAVRKMTQAMKTSNAGFQVKNSLLQSLSDQTGIDLSGRAAGIMMSKKAPTGVSGVLTGQLTISNLMHIALYKILPALVVTSPRAAGMALQTIGVAKGAVQPVMDALANQLGKVGTATIGSIGTDMAKTALFKQASDHFQNQPSSQPVKLHSLNIQ